MLEAAGEDEGEAPNMVVAARLLPDTVDEDLEVLWNVGRKLDA